jgi:predicted nucleic acid-binding Zn ribbon protein
MSRRSGKSTRLGEELQRYLERSGIAERIEQAAVVPEWPERVGPAIAAATRPLRVDAGVLFVAVRSSAWMMELELMKREILARLNAGRGRGRIERIRFVLSED